MSAYTDTIAKFLGYEKGWLLLDNLGSLSLSLLAHKVINAATNHENNIGQKQPLQCMLRLPLIKRPKQGIGNKFY